MTGESHLDLDPRVAEFVRSQGLDTPEGAMNFGSGEDLVKPGLGQRRRTRIQTPSGEALYLKRYGPAGREQPPGPLEFANIRAIRAAGVATMHAIAAGVEPDSGRSFLLVSSVPGDAMERVGQEFLQHADEAHLSELTRNLAGLVGRLHRAGWVHRDLYASHVFLHETEGRLDLYLIDLARAFQPNRWRRRRWIVKDLGQLKFSMPPSWVENQWEAFMKAYLQIAPLPGLPRRLSRAIDRKVRSMRRQQRRRKLRKEASCESR